MGLQPDFEGEPQTLTGEDPSYYLNDGSGDSQDPSSGDGSGTSDGGSPSEDVGQPLGDGSEQGDGGGGDSSALLEGAAAVGAAQPELIPEEALGAGLVLGGAYLADQAYNYYNQASDQGGDSASSDSGDVSSGDGSDNFQDPEVTFGHGARHLEGSGLSQDNVESAIEADVKEKASQQEEPPTEGDFNVETVPVGDQTIEYHTYQLPNNTVNVGTYYPVDSGE